MSVEVFVVQPVPSDEVRIVPELPTTTKVLFPYAPPLSFSDGMGDCRAFQSVSDRR